MSSVFPFECYSDVCDTPEEAWTSFDKNLRDITSWINGYHYWRTPPELQSQALTFSDKTVYRIRARLIASKTLIEGEQVIEIGGPYPEPKNPCEGMAGFGLMPKQGS